jgi:hypothetical protein
MSINNRYGIFGNEQISKREKNHVAIEDPGAINKLFKRNFAAAVRVHDPATAIAAPCDGDMVDPCGSLASTLEDPDSQEEGSGIPRRFCDYL